LASTLLYLAMGWAGGALIWPGAGAEALAPVTMALMLAGGGLYTVGVAFLMLERMPFHNAVWHGFVLSATFVFYAAVMTELFLRGAG
jgi:hemolysin III